MKDHFLKDCCSSAAINKAACSFGYRTVACTRVRFKGKLIQTLVEFQYKFCHLLDILWMLTVHLSCFCSTFCLFVCLRLPEAHYCISVSGKIRTI